MDFIGAQSGGIVGKDCSLVLLLGSSISVSFRGETLSAILGN